MISNLDRDEVKAGLANGTLLVVDVREPHEYAQGRIPGAVSRPLSRLDLSDIPEAAGKRIVLSCVAGVRSMQAAMIARSQGVPVDAHYVGGFRDWIMAGEAVERD